MTGMGDSDQKFDSQFNNAIAKLIRMDSLLKTAHAASISDDHTTWKVSLDALYRELDAYLDDSDSPNDIMDTKKKCQQLLLDYLKWEDNKNKIYASAAQAKQIKLEEALDSYQKLLMHALKNHNMDLHGADDLTRLLARGSY